MRGERDKNDGVREWRREKTAVRRTNWWGEKEGAKRKEWRRQAVKMKRERGVRRRGLRRRLREEGQHQSGETRKRE